MTVRTIYMTNSKHTLETPLFSFTTQEDLEWYVVWKLSCSTNEAKAMLDVFARGIPFQEEFSPHIQYEIRSGE